jgi:RNA polymerase sigma factor (sigma-70 family)
MDCATRDDHHLLTAWVERRDGEAFEALCLRHAGLVGAACRRHGSPDADEAAQAVFMVLARRAASAPASALAGWLTITSRQIVEHQRRASARRRRHEQEAAVDQAHQHASVVTEPSWDEARQHLDAALASLSPARREAVLRFYLEGKPQAQVAAELGCSVDAVKTRIHESLERLRDFFTRRGVAVGAAVLASGLASEAIASEPTLVAACTHAVLNPAVAPGAAALAHGVITAMIIKTATFAAAAILLAGSCLTAALVTGAEASPPPAPAASLSTAQPPAPSASATAPPAPPEASQAVAAATAPAPAQPVQARDQMRELSLAILTYSLDQNECYPDNLAELMKWAKDNLPDLTDKALIDPGHPEIRQPFLYVRPLGKRVPSYQPILVQDPACNLGAGSLVVYADCAVRFVKGTDLWDEAQRLAALPKAHIRDQGIEATDWILDPLTGAPPAAAN